MQMYGPIRRSIVQNLKTADRVQVMLYEQDGAAILGIELDKRHVTKKGRLVYGLDWLIKRELSMTAKFTVRQMPLTKKRR